jgi:hypothetical protein
MSSVSPFDQLGNGGSASGSVSALSPKAAVVETNKALRFSSSPDVSWSSTGGKMSSDGTFSSSITGSFLVVGHGKTKTDSARVTVVNANQPRLISVSPRQVQLTVGQTVQFTDSVTLPNGTPTTLDVVWSSDGGSVDKFGNFIAGTVPGTFSVIASAPSAGVADTAVVTVTPVVRHIVQMFLAPAAAVLLADSSTQYVATAQYDDGTVGPAMVSFGVSGGGSIDSKGRFTAGQTAGTYAVTATVADGSVRVSTPVTVTSPTGAVASTAVPSSEHPNEPADYVGFGAVGFDRLALSAECPNWHKGPAGCWWRYGVLQSVKSDSSAPDRGSLLELTFPLGLRPGYSQNSFGGWAVGGPIEYSAIYESGWVKIPTQDFETQMACVKLFGYWGVGERRSDMNPIQIAGEIPGNGQATALMSSWNIMFVQQNVTSRRLNQNLNLSKKLTAGSWHHYEVRMTVNDIGQANGQLSVWLDEVPILSYTDVVYRTADNTAGFFGRKWDPIWGCQGGDVKTRDDHLWVSQLYLSGIRM